MSKIGSAYQACEDAAKWSVMDQLDTYGAPPGDTIEERLRAWEQRERALRDELERLKVATLEIRE